MATSPYACWLRTSSRPSRLELTAVRCILRTIMKAYKKYLSPRHWLAFLRRQPAHMQHVYAICISGGVTALLAVAILYFDYGLWRDRYSRTESFATTTIQTSSSEIETVSPGAMLGDFFKEASVRVQAIKSQKVDFLEGEEVYTKESTSTIEN